MKRDNTKIKREYLTAREIRGNLMVFDNVHDVTYNEIVQIRCVDAMRNGKPRIKTGRVIELLGNTAVVLVFEGVSEFTLTNTRTRFMGQPMTLALSREILGRVFDGMGRPVDGVARYPIEAVRPINGKPMNPTLRLSPRLPLLTGVSAIDGLMTFMRGQKLPIFSGDGLPHDRLAAQIAAQFITTTGADAVVIFAAMGCKYDTATYFQRQFEESGALSQTALFLNMADDPPAERLITPRLALTAAEFFAFDHACHVLVILTDMTAYAESVRAISAARGEVPGRRGYPGYLYSDLATLYERAGTRKDNAGSVTLLPIVTLPDDDITHPIPDLTGFITEGQIVLGRDLHARGIYPPIAVLPSLSRLMKDGIGAGKTLPDHPALARQLFARYAQVADVRALRTIVGDDGLTDADKETLVFGDQFESNFIHQGASSRTLVETIDIARQLVALKSM